jgi:hypothetical protein
MSRSLNGLADDPVRLGFWTFSVALTVQLLHQVEHVAQIMQKDLWGWDKWPGLLGQWFDFEWIHFLYNAALFMSVMAVAVIYLKNPGIWSRSGSGHYALMFATLFQGYHLVEHTAKLIQYLGSGSTVLGRGLVGQFALVVAFAGFKPWTSLGRPDLRADKAHVSLPASIYWPVAGAMRAVPTHAAQREGLMGTVFMLGFFAVALWLLALALRLPRRPEFQRGWSDGSVEVAQRAGG